MANEGPMAVDMGLARELAQLLETAGLTEIEVADGERRIRVARAVASVAMAPALPAQAAAAPQPAAEPDPASHPGTVRSPMVGTAYLTPEPGAEPFVREGDTVAEGDTLIIVEAMKVLNPITAPRAGRVLRLLVAHEQPVEYDQPLIVIG